MAAGDDHDERRAPLGQADYFFEMTDLLSALIAHRDNSGFLSFLDREFDAGF
jgi:hypothetical protein